MRILGLMTGTSVGAIDACLVTWADRGDGDLHAIIEETHEWSWPGDLRERISDLVTGDAVVSMPELIDVDAQIGEAIGTACTTLADRDINLIVSLAKRCSIMFVAPRPSGLSPWEIPRAFTPPLESPSCRTCAVRILPAVAQVPLSRPSSIRSWPTVRPRCS